jgi:geranylgeranylglycerol-phosphate geranylgeranyltransferase
MIDDWVKLARLSNALVAGLGVLLGHACLPSPINWPMALLGALALAFLAIAGNIHNDVLDLEADRINRPDRPLPSGRLAIKPALGISIAFYFTSMLLAFSVGIASGLLTLAMAILLIAYNLKLKALPLWGNLSIALLCALAIYFPELPSLPWHWEFPIYTGLPALFAFLTTLAREIAKDAEDIPGDAAVGWKTFPIHYGLNATRWLMGLLCLLILGSLPIPYFWLGYHWSYGLLILIGPLPLLLGIEKNLWRSHSDWRTIQKHLKGIMLAGMVAILVGINI